MATAITLRWPPSLGIGMTVIIAAGRILPIGGVREGVSRASCRFENSSAPQNLKDLIDLPKA
jgi:hypothetical protein